MIHRYKYKEPVANTGQCKNCEYFESVHPFDKFCYLEISMCYIELSDLLLVWGCNYQIMENNLKAMCN